VLFKAMGGLFFANNQAFLKFTVDAGAFLEAISFAIGIYLVFYMRLPNKSPWLGFSPILIIGLILTYLTIKTPSQPFLEGSKAINWGFQSGQPIVSVLRFVLFIGVFLPLLIIYIQEMKRSNDSMFRNKVLKQIYIFFLIILVSFFDFIAVTMLEVDPFWRDLVLIPLSILLVFV